MDAKFFARFGGGGDTTSPLTPEPVKTTVNQSAAPKVEEPTPALPEKPVEQAPVPQAPTTPDDAFSARFSGNASAAPIGENPADGAMPETAIPESPLSIMDRAMLGWVRTPQAQEELLKQHYKEVKLIPGEGEASFAVKDGGKWFQVDPHMSWSIPGVSALKGSEVLKDVAQSVGEYGLRSAGVALGTGLMGAAALAAAPVAAVGVPLALLTTGSAVGLGAMGGSAVAEGVDQLARSTLAQGTPGKDLGDLKDQLAAAAMFGVQDYDAGGAITLGAKGVSKVVGGIAKRMVDTPEGRAAFRKLFGMLGADERLVEARMQNPMRNATYDHMAAADHDAGTLIGKGSLDRAEDQVFSSLEDHVYQAVRREGKEFEALASNPKVRAARIQASEPFSDTLTDLQNNGLLTDKNAFNQNFQYGEGDQEALQYIVRQSKRAGDLSYKDSRELVMSLNNLIQKNPSAFVQKKLINLRDGINNSIIRDIGDAAGDAYASTMQKYRVVKSMANDFSNVTDGNKKYTFIKRLLSDDKNATKDAVQGMIDAGVPADTIYNMAQIQGARQSLKWFAKGKVLKYIPSPGPKVAATAISNFSAVKQGLKDIPQHIVETTQMDPSALAKLIPYFGQATKTLRNLPASARQSVLTNPAALDVLTNMVGAAAADEKSGTDQLLQESGVK